MYMKSFLICGALMGLAACGQYSDGLVGDYVSASSCPANSCADSTPNVNYLSLSTNSTSINLDSTAARFDLSGDCYPSTYPTNKINVTVIRQTGSAVMTAPASAALYSTTTPVCKNGRFDMAVNASALATGYVYTVQLQLVAYDTAGAAHTSASGGYMEVTLRK